MLPKYLPYNYHDLKFIFPYCIVLSIIFYSCAPSYTKYVSGYKRSDKSNTPDYHNLYYWAAHPDKKDLADSIPRFLKPEIKDTLADVFFIHPTTYTERVYPKGMNNAAIDDADINAKTDYTSILYQASVFNASARIFAPRYRQAHLSAFFTMNKQEAAAALDTAYTDIRNAFEYYLKNCNKGRPIIIASHSQGTLLAARLLKDFFENKPLKNQLVCAYLIGMPLYTDYFTDLSPCNDSISVGCFVSWRTLKKNYLPRYAKKEIKPAFVTNPLVWTSDTDYVARKFNAGAVLWKFNKLIPHPNGAQIHKNVLWIPKPKFPFSFLVPIKNFHPGDINLFYMNIRENAKTRIDSFIKKASLNDGHSP